MKNIPKAILTGIFALSLSMSAFASDKRSVAPFSIVLPSPISGGQFGNGPIAIKGKVRFQSYDIAWSCNNELTIYFYNTLTPNFGVTNPVWILYVPAGDIFAPDHFIAVGGNTDCTGTNLYVNLL
jgi:hypothetical protein